MTRYVVTTDDSAHQLPDAERSALAADIGNTGTVEGAAVHAAVNAGATDSGWQNMGVNSGFTGSSPQARTIGPMVHFRGGFTNTGMSASGSFTVGTVSASYRPAVDSYVAIGASGGGTIALGVFRANGNVEIRTAPSLGSYYMFDGISLLTN